MKLYNLCDNYGSRMMGAEIFVHLNRIQHK